MEDRIKEIKARFNMSLSTKEPIYIKLLATTNRKFQKYVMEDKLEAILLGQMLWLPEYGFHTSYIIKVEYKLKNQFHITTRNSVYVIEVLDVEFLSWFTEEILFEMSSDEIDMVEKYLRGEVE